MNLIVLPKLFHKAYGGVCNIKPDVGKKEKNK